jgi:hypothetical protein
LLGEPDRGGGVRRALDDRDPESTEDASRQGKEFLVVVDDEHRRHHCRR